MMPHHGGIRARAPDAARRPETMLDLNSNRSKTSQTPGLDHLFQTSEQITAECASHQPSATDHDLTARSAPLPSPTMRRFTHEYLNDFNENQPALRIGNSLSSSRITTSKMLANVRVRQVVAAAEKRALRTLPTQAFRALVGNPGQNIAYHQLGRGQRSHLCAATIDQQVFAKIDGPPSFPLPVREGVGGWVDLLPGS
jgi:hypothetical protein